MGEYHLVPSISPVAPVLASSPSGPPATSLSPLWFLPVPSLPAYGPLPSLFILPALGLLSFRLGDVLTGSGPPTQVPGDTEFLGGGP